MLAMLNNGNYENVSNVMSFVAVVISLHENKSFTAINSCQFTIEKLSFTSLYTLILKESFIS